MKKVFLNEIKEVLVQSTFACKLITIFMSLKQNMEMYMSSRMLAGYL